jgi:drug/metabolite transporter (DMT)-like permease
MTNTAHPKSAHPTPARHLTSSSARTTGLALAGVTAVVSGMSVFVNGYGVARFDDATTYTTAKNLVAAVLITAILVAQHQRRALPSTATRTRTRTRTRVSLAAVAVIGGSVPFVLFFEGLARVSSSDAAFIHKTLVAWVAILAVLFLGERIAPPHVVAIVLILVGYSQLAGGVGFPEVGSGEALIMAATLCWSVEVVLVRSLLRRGVPEMVVGTSRMAGGIVLLLGWAVVRGAVGDLVGLSGTQWAWALLTGLFLTGFVVSWHHALARAPAVDVTAVLSMGAVLTALLNTGVRGAVLQPAALALLVAGGALVIWSSATASRPAHEVAAP